MSETTIIDLIRHGEPVGGSKYRGHIDDPLSEKGWRQMREAVAEHNPWQAVVSSPLSRCCEFAEQVAQRYGLPVEIDDRLMEIGFGEWEGKTKDEISASDADALRRFYDDPIQHRPPGAETLDEFSERVTSAWQYVLQRHHGQHVLLVGHAGVIRMLMCHVLGMPMAHMFRINVVNAGITRIRIDGHGDDALVSLMFHGGRVDD